MFNFSVNNEENFACRKESRDDLPPAGESVHVISPVNLFVIYRHTHYRVFP